MAKKISFTTKDGRHVSFTAKKNPAKRKRRSAKRKSTTVSFMTKRGPVSFKAKQNPVGPRIGTIALASAGAYAAYILFQRSRLAQMLEENHLVRAQRLAAQQAGFVAPGSEWMVQPGGTAAKAAELYRKVGQKAFADTMNHQTEKQLGIEVAWGAGKIIDKNTVEVNGKIYKGKNLVIGTGSRPTMPDIPGIDLPGVMTYKNHPDMRTDPKRMVIIGGGKIGIGKAAMFAPFNIDVTVLEKYTCGFSYRSDRQLC